MDRRQIGTKLVLDALGVEVKLDSFARRLIVQKTVYLAQASGLELGYFFRWYLKGPYCPELTGDVFAIESEFNDDEAQSWSLDKESGQTLESLRSLIPQEGEQERARQLELLASVHFLVDSKQLPSDTVACLKQRPDAFNKNFEAGEIEDALTQLRHHELLPGQ